MSKKFLEGILLGGGGGYFFGYVNGINGSSGCQISGVATFCKWVLRALFLLLRWPGESLGTGADWGVEWSNYGI